MRFTVGLFGSVFTVLGILYAVRGDVLWGMSIVVLGLIYLFGFESYGKREEFHLASHLFVGGLLATVFSSFLLLEKFLHLFEGSVEIGGTDVLMILTGAAAFSISLIARRKFS